MAFLSQMSVSQTRRVTRHKAIGVAAPQRRGNVELVIGEDQYIAELSPLGDCQERRDAPIGPRRRGPRQRADKSAAIAAGEYVMNRRWSADVTGGTPPYSYQWQETQHNTLSPQSGWTQTYTANDFNSSFGYTEVVLSVSDANNKGSTKVFYVQHNSSGGSYDPTYCH